MASYLELRNGSKVSLDSIVTLFSNELKDLPQETQFQLYIALWEMLPLTNPSQEFVDGLATLVRQAATSTATQADAPTYPIQVLEVAQTITEPELVTSILLNLMKVHAKEGTLSPETLVVIVEAATRHLYPNPPLNKKFGSTREMLTVRRGVEEWLLTQNLPQFETLEGQIVVNLATLEKVLEPVLHVANKNPTIAAHISELKIQRFNIQTFKLKENQSPPKNKRDCIQYQDVVSLIVLLRIKNIFRPL